MNIFRGEDSRLLILFAGSFFRIATLISILPLIFLLLAFEAISLIQFARLSIQRNCNDGAYPLIHHPVADFLFLLSGDLCAEETGGWD